MQSDQDTKCPKTHEDKQWAIWLELRKQLTEEQVHAMLYLKRKYGQIPL